MAQIDGVNAKPGSPGKTNSNTTPSSAAASAPPPAAFELYDPRGLLNRRRSQSRGGAAGLSASERGAIAQAGSSSSNHDRGTNSSGQYTYVRDRKDSTATTSSLMSVREDDSYAASNGSPAGSVSPSYVAVASAGSTPERGRLAKLQIHDSPSTTPSSSVHDGLTSSMPDLRHQDSHHTAASGRQAVSEAGRSRSRSPLPSNAGGNATAALQASPAIAQERQPSNAMSMSMNFSDAGDSAISNMDLASSGMMSPAAEFLGSFSASGRESLLGRARSTSTAGSSQGKGTQSHSTMHTKSGAHARSGDTVGAGAGGSSSSFMRSFIAPDPDEEGEEVDGYILEGTIGQGTFSTVRRARHVETGEIVAVKVVRHSHSPSAQYHLQHSHAPPQDRHGISWADARLGADFVAESVNGQADGPKRVKRDSVKGKRPAMVSPPQNEDDEEMDAESSSRKPGFRRARSCSSPVMPLKGRQGMPVDGLPPSSDSDYYQMASSMSIDGMDSAPTTPLNESPPRESSEERQESISASGTGGGTGGGIGDLSLADPALQREVSIWSQLDQNHPHILPLLHYYEDHIASYIFMPLCQSNLLQYVKTYGRGGSKSPEMQPAVSPSATPGKSAMLPPPALPGNPLSRKPSVHSSASTSVSGSPSSSGVTNKPQRSSSIRMRPASQMHPHGAGLPLSAVQKIFAQVVVGLKYLHTELQVTHKDIKLENILLDDGNTVKISDFGLAYAPSLLENSALGALPASGMDIDMLSPVSSPGAGPVSAHPFRDDPRARREHALSEGDAPIASTSYSPPAITSGTPTGPVAFSSLTAAASTLMPSAKSPNIPIAGSQSNGDARLDDLSTSLPASAFPVSRPSIAQRRSQAHQAVSTSLSGHAAVHAYDAGAGSLQYTSPEQIRSPAPVSNVAVDIWALGCVLYALIDGRLPFDDGFEPRLRVNIMKGEWKVPPALKVSLDNVKGKIANAGPLTDSPVASPKIVGKDSEIANIDGTDEDRRLVEEVLRGCLEVDVQRRWSIQQISEHVWLKEAVASIEAANQQSSMESGSSQDSSSMSPSRGRRKHGLDTLDEMPSELDTIHSRVRDRSRGRRGGPPSRDDSLERPSRSSSRRPASSRRGPSADEYRAARGEGRSSSGSRSRRAESRPRRYGGEAVNTWELL